MSVENSKSTSVELLTNTFTLKGKQFKFVPLLVELKQVSQSTAQLFWHS